MGDTETEFNAPLARIWLKSGSGKPWLFESVSPHTTLTPPSLAHSLNAHALFTGSGSSRQSSEAGELLRVVRASERASEWVND